MKNTSLQSNLAFASSERCNALLRTMLLSLMIALPVTATSSTRAQAQSSNRVVQELGACNGGSAEYIGNAHKGKSKLTSYGPDRFAGFIFEGLKGTTVKQLATLDVDFDPPNDVSTYSVTLRVLVSGNRAQNFTVGENDNPNLPNLPTTKFGELHELHVLNGSSLLGEKSILTENDVIEKISFIFSGTKKVDGPTLVCNVLNVGYASGRVPVSLERVTCNLR